MTEENGKLQYIQCSLVTPNRHQPRTEFDQKALEELADSIDEDGLIQPIVVRYVEDVPDKEFEIVAGERRFRAVYDILGKKRIQALVRETDHETSATQALVENVQREDLNPLEEALAIQSMMKEQHLNQEQAATKIGKSRVHVTNALRLLKLPDPVQLLMKDNKLTRHQGLTLLGAPKEKIEKLADDTAKHNWPVDMVKKKINSMKSDKAPAKEGKQKKDAPTSTYLVLVECESAKEQKEFVKQVEEGGYKCWTGKAARDYIAPPKAEEAEEKKPAVRRRVRKAS